MGIPIATILSVGDELLIGQTPETNSSWLSQQLNRAGLWVHRKVVIGDIREDIVNSIRKESEGVQLLMITGGLGPTSDDQTKYSLCEFFECKLVFDLRTLEHVSTIFNAKGMPLLDRNRHQALVPENCIVLFNQLGTAPGMWFEKNNTIIVALPGVPNEMKGIMVKEVIPRLKMKFNSSLIMHKTIITIGKGESYVAERLVGFEKGLPNFIKLAYIPSDGILKIRLNAIFLKSSNDLFILYHKFFELKALLADITIDDNDTRMEELVGRLLLKNQSRVCTAESCTGGYIAHLLTLVPGCSAYFDGSLVCYSAETKVKVLGLDPKLIFQFGVVSQPVVEQMVSAMLNYFGSDIAIAVSGIMGPEGGSHDMPIGSVWISIGTRNQTFSQLKRFSYDREMNIRMTSFTALNLLREFLIQRFPKF